MIFIAVLWLDQGIGQAFATVISSGKSRIKDIEPLNCDLLECQLKFMMSVTIKF
jgi:hypothetical protein